MKQSYSEIPNLYQKCLTLGSSAMVILLLLTLTSLVISFSLSEHFSLPIQIVSHIATIIFSALFKVAYVVRCIGAYHLGHSSF
jgi:membrane-bound ClpP family serine protease